MDASTVKIELTGRIDSNNAAEEEQRLQSLLTGRGAVSVKLDASRLEYISSAGLRILLRLKKKYPDLTIMGVNSEVYEILDMTGFTEIMRVEKAYRVVSVEGCEVIGEGANGKVYRIDQDNVVKTYKNADALSEIQHEREVARLALVLGIPTAISYDVVRVGDSYGSVFELLNARSFAKILAQEPEKLDWCVKEYVDLLKKIHSTVVPAGKLPSFRETMLERTRRSCAELPSAAAEKLERMIAAVPERDTMIHGDFHTKNVVLAGDEVLLIDMDTLSVGHPIFELAQMYNSFVGYSEYDPGVVLGFQGYDFATAKKFWKGCLKAYMGTGDEKALSDAEDRIRIAGYARLLDWGRRHYDPTDKKALATAELWKKHLLELLDRVDDLDLDISSERAPDYQELVIAAEVDNLPKVMEFVDQLLEAAGCSLRTQMQLDVAVEEIFVNIANYAYAPGKGEATVRMSISPEREAVITFMDRGMPYDPLAREDPDLTLPVEKREIGGLGVLMAKKSADEMTYEYRDGMNILTMKKKL